MSKVGKGCAQTVQGSVNAEITNWDEMPLGIEAGIAPVACIVDDVTGVVVGKTFLCKVVDEATGAETWMRKYALYGAAGAVDVLPAGTSEADCTPAAPDSYLPVQLEELCANVDGVPQAVVPVAWFNGADRAYVETTYLDELGNPIAGVVTAADPCDCPCVDCPPVAAQPDAFPLEPVWYASHTKFNLDDPAFSNAYSDTSLGGILPWTAASLADALNISSPNATAANTGSGIDYTTTVWAAGNNGTVDYVYVVSGPVPTTLDLVSIPVSIPVATV